MSANFSLLSWVLHLPLASSCIDGDGHQSMWDQERSPRYYALAEDWKGSHCPYPKLPELCKQIFDVRVRMAYGWTARFHDWQLRTEYLMLGHHWPVHRRNRVILTMRRIDRLFFCRRRGYSWHFHCSLCMGISFFDLGGSRWACKKCGQRNPAEPVRTPRFSLLTILQNFETMCNRIDKRPEWKLCRYCGKGGYNAGPMGNIEIITSTVQDLDGKPVARQHACCKC
jgi:hypothetical protein